MTKHTADEFSAAEWTAFWRENGEKRIMTQHESIFKGTIRKHEWRNYSAFMADRLTSYAPAGTLKVHTFDMEQARQGCIGAVSYEPPPVELETGATEAMRKAIELFAPRTDFVSLP